MVALAGLVAGLASQVVVLWGAVLIVQSSALTRFRNLGPGSLGDLTLMLAVTLALEAALAGLLMLPLRRHRRGLAVLALTLALGAAVAGGVVIRYAMA